MPEIKSRDLIGVALLIVLIIFNTFAEQQIRLVEDRGQDIVLTFSLPQFKIKNVSVNSKTCSYISMPDAAYLNEKGFPQLPKFSQSIIIPDNAAMDIDVVSIRYKEIPVETILPAKGVIYRNQNPAKVPYEFGAVYNEDVWYPAKPVTLSEPYILRDIRGIVIHFQPFQYNAVKGILRVAESMTVKVKPDGISTHNVLIKKKGITSEAFNKMYQKHFLNYQQYSSRYTPVPDGDAMIVISAALYKSAVSSLVTWKNKKGIKTDLYEYPTETGGSGTTALKTFIQNKYDTEDIAYVLLVGDAADIPSISAGGGLSDPSYILLAGSDLYPDAFIGRFSVESSAEATVMVNKVLNYEMNPDASGEWYHKGTGIASAEGTPTDKEWVEEFRVMMLAYNYTEVDQIYDPGASKSQVTSALNDGRGWINYMGHGSKTRWGTTGFGNSGVTALTNGDMLPVITSVACVNGEFGSSGQCFAEAWTRGSGKGAMVFLGATISMAWVPPQHAQKEMVRLLCEDSYISVGGIVYNGECKMLDIGNDQNTFLTWHLFGDPSLMVFTDTPEPLTVTYPQSVGAGQQDIQISFSTAIDGRVCLYSDASGILASQILSGSASATLAVDVPPSEPTMHLTVTARNKMPVMEEIDVNAGSYIRVTSPNGGEEWEPERTYNIQWTDNIEANVKIEVLKGGVLHSTPASSIPSTSPFSWAIPDTVTPGADYKIRITCVDTPSITDESNDYFSIIIPSIAVVYPNGGEVLYIDSVANITWATAGIVGSVQILYSTNNGVDWDTVVSSTANDGIYGWVVPNVPSAECKIRISEAADGDPIDESDGVFTIEVAPSITVTSPNGGEKLYTGDTHLITWTSQGIVGVVKIEYSINQGAVWTTIVANTLNNGTFHWVVPSVNSNLCLVRVSKAAGGVPSDVSDAVFAIEPAPAITVTFPNGGETLFAKLSTNITWTSAGSVGDVKILFSPDNGINWYTVTASTPNLGTHPWTVPDSISPNCKIQISDASDGDPVDESDAVFAIVPLPDITIISPNGGETLLVGKTHTITWTYIGNVGNVRIEYSADNGVSWNPVTTDAPNTGSFVWIVPTVHSAFCKIRIFEALDSLPVDVSDEIFSIEPAPSIAITYPNGGELLVAQSTVNITWTSTGTVSGVKVLYSTDNGGNWYTVVASTANDGTHPWIVPGSVSNQCLVQISEAADGDPVDVSDAVFSIEAAPVITVTSPDGGEEWEIGTEQNITWTTAGTVGNVKIEYSVDNGGTWTEIVASTANDNTHSWTIPAKVSVNCKIRISEAADGNPFDESDGVFSIDYTNPINEIPDDSVSNEVQFSAAPNPVIKATGEFVQFQITPGLQQITGGMLAIYDPTGNCVYETSVPYCDSRGPNKIGSWDVRNKNDRKVAVGSYLAVVTFTDSEGKVSTLKALIGVKEEN